MQRAVICALFAAVLLSNACIEDADNSGQGSGCLSCDEDACSECWEGYALSADGTCIQCDTPTRTGALEDEETEVLCYSCDPEDPSFCTGCDSLGGGRMGGPPVWATSSGACALCDVEATGTENCYECSNLNATCTNCYPGRGLVEDAEGRSVCEDCEDDSCTVCDGDVSVCTACHSKSHSFPDPETGRCVPCIDNCAGCSSSDTCDECFYGYTFEGEDRSQCVTDPSVAPLR